MVVMNRTGFIVVQDDKGRDRERYQVIYGARLKVKDGEAVDTGKILVEWDPYTFSILTEEKGQIRFKDIIDGVTVREDLDVSSAASGAVQLADYDPEPVRDLVRGRIALYLISVLAAMVAASFLMLYADPWHSDKLVTVLQIVFGPVTTLVGAATGYYFGANANAKPK